MLLDGIFLSGILKVEVATLKIHRKTNLPPDGSAPMSYAMLRFTRAIITIAGIVIVAVVFVMVPNKMLAALFISMAIAVLQVTIGLDRFNAEFFLYFTEELPTAKNILVCERLIYDGRCFIVVNEYDANDVLIKESAVYYLGVVKEGGWNDLSLFTKYHSFKNMEGKLVLESNKNSL